MLHESQLGNSWNWPLTTCPYQRPKYETMLLRNIPVLLSYCFLMKTFNNNWCIKHLFCLEIFSSGGSRAQPDCRHSRMTTRNARLGFRWYQVNTQVFTYSYSPKSPKFDLNFNSFRFVSINVFNYKEKVRFEMGIWFLIYFNWVEVFTF